MSGLTIVKAMYGAPQAMEDVTKQLQAMEKDGNISVVVSAQNFGILDPAPGVAKTLETSVVINKGNPTIGSTPEGSTFQISAPREGRRSLGSRALSFTGSLFGWASYAAVTFLHLLNVFIAYTVGSKITNSKGGGAVVGAIAFFIPFFSFWLLPIILFVMMLFGKSPIDFKGISTTPDVTNPIISGFWESIDPSKTGTSV